MEDEFDSMWTCLGDALSIFSFEELILDPVHMDPLLLFLILLLVSMRLKPHFLEIAPYVNATMSERSVQKNYVSVNKRIKKNLKIVQDVTLTLKLMLTWFGEEL